MNIFDEVRKISGGNKAPKSNVTIFKLGDYHLDPDPRKCYMTGVDMMNTDEDGVPKKVKVEFYDKNNKSRGIQDFADQTTMMHTQPGGMIRLDRYAVKADGTLVSAHMQRVSRNEGPLKKRNGFEYTTGIARGWAKILPKNDQNGEIAVDPGAAAPRHRASAFFIPEAAETSRLAFGTDYANQFNEVAKRAIDQAPDKAKPMILIRQDGKLQTLEIVIPNVKKTESGDYVPMTKKEQLALVPELKRVKEWMMVNTKPAAQGVEHDVTTGFVLDAYGMVNDPHSGKPLDQSRVEEFLAETTRNMAIPKGPDETEQRYQAHSQREYQLSVISFEIENSDRGNSASLQTLGKVKGVTPSPVAVEGRITPNPFYAAPEGTPSVPQAAASAAASAPAPAPAAPAPVAQQPAPELKPEPQPDAPAQSEQDFDDSMDYAMGDMDFDMDDLESQLSNQGL